MNMELLDITLNKWSIIIQISILLVLLLVFIALWINYPRREVKNWTLAWTSNLFGIITIYIVLLGLNDYPKFLITALYLLYSILKILFATLLVNGLSRYLAKRNIYKSKLLKFLPIVFVVYSSIILICPISTIHIQIITYTIIGVILILGSLILLSKTEIAIIKLIPLVFAFEGVVFIHHAWVLYPVIWGGSYPKYMTHISFFDSIVELIVGISCLFAINYKVVKEVQESHAEIEKTHESLRLLVDNDPLTGLNNRRKLDEFVKACENKCTLIYIDVNDFKIINDTWGHRIGDICLQNIAQLLTNLSNDSVGKFRLGGDEFLVVIPQENDLNIQNFLKQLNQRLKTLKNIPKVSLAIGKKIMDGSISFSVALQQADEEMYLAKKRKNK